MSFKLDPTGQYWLEHWIWDRVYSSWHNGCKFGSHWTILDAIFNDFFLQYNGCHTWSDWTILIIEQSINLPSKNVSSTWSHWSILNRLAKILQSILQSIHCHIILDINENDRLIMELDPTNTYWDRVPIDLAITSPQFPNMTDFLILDPTGYY